MTKEELHELFSRPYDTLRWQQMLIDFFGAREIRTVPRELTSEHDDKVEGRELGKLSLPGFQIGLYEFEIKQSYCIEFNRVGLRSLVKSYLKYHVDAALAVYYQGNRWRLSYICDLDEGKTAPKHFTYLFGNPDETYRTPIDRFLFLKENGITRESIRDAFSVEKLTADFFSGYKAQFKKFCAHIGGEEKWQRDYVKKLLGRLVFLQFLQKKGWMGVPQGNESWSGGDPNYLRTLVERHAGNDRLLTEVLEPLFFETLNRKREDDLADPLLGKGIRIPYLNGGLFDRDELDRRQIDFPFAFFDNLIEFFSYYNFTIDENDPDDADVGIDPEMLGHIFENLLEDNKDKGTFYTPKEIVQYMSRESLIQYLRSHTDASLHPAVEQLIRTGDVDFTLRRSNAAAQIDTLLKNVKVCDPAIGSGAFPMGVLSEIYKSRRKLYGYMNDGKEFSPSKVKREIIQNNIYGVDIEQGAVDIARLRFWLSLVVDEEQPQPLPNLDYKIMQGNSLLESFEGIDLSRFAGQPEPNGELFGSVFEAQTSEAIEPLVERYFSVTDHLEKERIRAEIDGIIRRHIEESLDRRERELTAKRSFHAQRVEANRQFIADASTTVANRRRYEKNLKTEELQLRQTEEQLAKVALSREHIQQVDRTNRPYFLWHLYFKDVFDRGGFDIVIANPPYVVTKRGTYEGYNWDTDLYLMFFELAIFKLMKKDGVLSYITPKFYLVNLSNTGLRNHLLTKTAIHHFVETSPFDAVTENVITMFSNTAPTSDRIRIFKEKGGIFKEKNIVSIPYCLSNRNCEIIISLNPRTIKLLDKIKTKTIMLGSISESKRGAEIGNAAIKKESSGLPAVIGSDVRKYYINWEHHFINPEHKEVKRLSKFFTNDNIVFLRRVGAELTSAVAEEDYICNKNLYGIVVEETVSKKYIVALLNSKLIDFYYKQRFSTKKEDAFPEIQTYLFESLPIKPLPLADQQPFIALVDRILEAKGGDPAADTTAIEAQIDRMVYDLYGLTEEEIAIVEGREPVPEQLPEKKRKEYDFFISHAAEDKNFVRPLAKALKKEGFKVWYDEFELKVGDSLRQKIDYGLANSRYGVVVISNHFINKNWTAYELNGMVTREIDGVKVVLPLWHNITKEEVMTYSPSLADKMALETDKYDIPQLVEKFKELLSK